MLDGSIAAMGVDMPIGLPGQGRERGPPGAWAATLVVFPTPVRRPRSETTDALERSRTVDGRSLEAGLPPAPRIAEVDES